MKIEKLSDCSVKIVLSQIDLYNYDIQYDDWDSDKATEFILSVSDKNNRKAWSRYNSGKAICRNIFKDKRMSYFYIVST